MVTSAAIAAVATEEIIAIVAVGASVAIVTIATEEIMATVAVGASAAIAALATEARMATVAVGVSTDHKVVAGTSVDHAVAAVPLAVHTEVVHSAEVVLSAEAAHVAEVHLAAAASTEVDLAAVVRSVEAHTATTLSSQLQLTHLSIHHTLYFVHGLAVIHCLNGFVDDAMANSKHLLSRECFSDIVKKCTSPRKEVF